MNTIRTLFVIVAWTMIIGCSTTGQTISGSTATSTYLYACNQGAATISVIDVSTQAVMKTIDLQQLGFSANAKPHHIVVEPDGSHWYVSLIGENTILKFDHQDRLVGQADFEVPGMLALDTGSNRIVVGRSMSAVNPPQAIGVIDRDDMSIDEIDVFFPRPHALALSTNGEYAFVASLAENRMMAVNLSTDDTDMATLDGDLQTFVQFAVSPDGTTMVGGGQMSGEVLFFDLSDPRSPRVTDTLSVGAQPWHPVFTPDGRSVYLGNKLDNSITVIDVASRRIAKVIRGNGIAQPHGSAISADGHYVYISNQNTNGDYTASDGSTRRGTIVVVDTSTMEIHKVIEVGMMPSGIGTRAR